MGAPAAHALTKALTCMVMFAGMRQSLVKVWAPRLNKLPETGAHVHVLCLPARARAW